MKVRLRLLLQPLRRHKALRTWPRRRRLTQAGMRRRFLQLAEEFFFPGNPQSCAGNPPEMPNQLVSTAARASEHEGEGHSCVIPRWDAMDLH